MVNYLAFCDVFNGYYGIVWYNQWFYYNFIIGKLEFIGFDGFGGLLFSQYEVLGSGVLNLYKEVYYLFFGSLFMDEDFVWFYYRVLYWYSSCGYLLLVLDSLVFVWYVCLEYLQWEFLDY